MAVEKMYASVSQSVTQPSEPTKAKTKAMPKYGKGKEKGKSEEKVEKKKIRGKRQPPEEEDGREWSERYYDEWKNDRTLRSNEVSSVQVPALQQGMDKHAGKDAVGSGPQRICREPAKRAVPGVSLPWGLESEQEFYDVQEKLEKFAVRLVSKLQDAKGRGKSLEGWDHRPTGRGRLDLKLQGNTKDETMVMVILGSLPRQRTCVVCAGEKSPGGKTAEPPAWRTICMNQRLWFFSQRTGSGSISRAEVLLYQERNGRTTRTISTSKSFACATSEQSTPSPARRTNASGRRRRGTRMTSHALNLRRTPREKTKCLWQPRKASRVNPVMESRRSGNRGS